jgi:acyl carrier protein
MSPSDPVHERIAAMVREATDGAVSPDRTTPLSELGVDSLGWLRLLDGLESTFEVEIDLGPAELRTATVDQLVARIAAAA